MKIEAVDIARCDAIYERWCKNGVPTEREIKIAFWYEIRKRSQAALDALDRDDPSTRAKAFGLRNAIREISQVMTMCDDDDFMTLKKYVHREKTERQEERNQAAFVHSKEFAQQIFREWLAEFIPIERAILSGHVSAKRYRKFYFRFKDALSVLKDVL